MSQVRYDSPGHYGSRADQERMALMSDALVPLTMRAQASTWVPGDAIPGQRPTPHRTSLVVAYDDHRADECSWCYAISVGEEPSTAKAHYWLAKSAKIDGATDQALPWLYGPA